jgi:uncharacterized protein (DUF362 family)
VSSSPALVSHVRARHGDGLAGAVARLVAPFGGWEAIVHPGERVAVKVNLLRGAPPEAAVSTHPETLREVLRGVSSAGAVPFVADSPGGPNTAARMTRVARTSGLGAVCEQEGVEFVPILDAGDTLEYPDGRLYRRFDVGRAFLDADAMVQVGVLKTHQLMRLTGGVKLAFGCIPGLTKAQLHIRASRREDFSDMLLDLYLALAPRFTIIDGILAMEGQGPGGGTPRALDSLFAARDAIALDAALADRTAHQRASIYTLAAAARRGLIDLDDPYELVGDPVETERTFVHARMDMEAMVPSRFRRVARRAVTGRPQLVEREACTRCGDCAAICGAQAITLSPEPVFDDQACVRCYACTEMCPTGAIDVVTPPLARLLARGRR